MYKIFTLHPKITEGKPGKLTELNITKLCKEYNIEFHTSKCFYVTELNSEESRGNHSNTNASELLVCLQGSYDITLHDGKDEVTLHLKQHDVVFIDKNVWIKYYNFKHCVIMAYVYIHPIDKDSCHDFNEFLLCNQTNEYNL